MIYRFEPPIDLSDLPGFSRADGRPRRSAFVGRVSTKDNQNPATSIPRQVELSSARLDPDEQFVAYYWDVESGLLPPELRGLGSTEMYDQIGVPTPRDGGLPDLVERAEHLGITHVVAERSDRLARAMLTSLTVEHELEKLGVEVEYANEPTGGTVSGRLRNRRYGQAEAEIYLATMKEMSAGGQAQHAINGWNHGYPPYPYIAVIDENAPVRSRGRFGEQPPKRKLAPHPDPRRFDAAAELCRLRREEHLRAADIVAILSADPDKYPVEDRDHHHSPTGRWTPALVESLIANPKLTGYQVYNRKAMRTGKRGYSNLNPISQWVWSPRITHEPVITLEEWKAAQQATDTLRAATGGGLALIRDAARRRGLTVAEIGGSDTHTVYQIGSRRIVLPDPIPAVLVAQVIADLEVNT